MAATKADIIAQLRRDILPLQGLKSTLGGTSVDVGLGPIKYAFPNSSFPFAAIHEFCYDQIENATASCGFIAGLLSTFMRNGGVSLWISSSRNIFPPALKFFGIEPDKIIFLDLQKQRDVLWAMEEALKCNSLTTVVAETQQISFNASRRLQLAVEQSRVTGFILHRTQNLFNITACVTRWKITSLPSLLPGDMPGVGFPRWNVELLKVRNGKPGSWQIEWTSNKFRHIPRINPIQLEEQKKTG